MRQKMADFEYREAVFGAVNAPKEDMQSGKIGKLVNATGALMSVALVAGIGVWGYNLLTRDATGVPVVRALDGPMRVQPDEPGGRKTAHQGLAVNGVQSKGVAQDVADRLVLAPDGAGVTGGDQAGLRSPAEMTPADDANVALISATPAIEISAPALLDQAEVSRPQTTTAAPEIEQAQMSSTDAAAAAAMVMADQLAQGITPLSSVGQPEKPTLKLVDISVPGVKHSARPSLRPISLNITPAAAPVEVAAAQVVSSPAREVVASQVKAGTRLAQLGAFDSEQIARKEWDKLYGQFTEYMEGKSRVIQKAESGGRVFYRLRAMGFDDLSDARRFCSALLAEKAACIPVKVR